MNELKLNEIVEIENTEDVVESENLIEVSSDTSNTAVLNVAQNIYSILSVISFIIMIVFIYKYLKTIIKVRR